MTTCNLWHDKSDCSADEGRRPIIIVYESGKIEYMYCGDEDFIGLRSGNLKWCYLDDLIPHIEKLQKELAIFQNATLAHAQNINITPPVSVNCKLAERNEKLERALESANKKLRPNAAKIKEWSDMAKMYGVSSYMKEIIEVADEINEILTPEAKGIDMKPVIDVCCGGRMFYKDKNDNRVVFMDIRELPAEKMSNGQLFSVAPDVVGDFTANPYPDNTFACVIFDPPHLRCGDKSFLFKRYGTLGADWKEVLSKGFVECFRILKPNGTLIFKWNDSYKKLSEVLALTPAIPLIVHTTKSQSGQKRTHFALFIKSTEQKD